MINPDRLLIDRIFQPFVDRIGADPRILAWAAFKAHVVGALSTSLVGWMLGFHHLSATWGTTKGTMHPLEPAVYIAAAAGTMALQRSELRRIGESRIHPYGIMMRVMSLFLSMAVVVVGALSLIPARIPLHCKALVLVFAVSWLLGTVFLYLHACRMPPPRTRVGRPALA